MHGFEYLFVSRVLEKAEPEPAQDSQKLIVSRDNDIRNDTLKQRRSKSAGLLKKELEAQGKAASRDFLIKVMLHLFCGALLICST